MIGLGGNHFFHVVRFCPHAFTDLRFTRQAQFDAHVYVPTLIGIEPIGIFHVVFTDKGTRFHTGVHLVTGTIHKACVNKDNAVFSNPDTFF